MIASLHIVIHLHYTIMFARDRPEAVCWSHRALPVPRKTTICRGRWRGGGESSTPEDDSFTCRAAAGSSGEGTSTQGILIVSQPGAGKVYPEDRRRLHGLQDEEN